MRRAGEEQLNRYDRFRSVDGTAEATTLADASVSLVAAGQAFHWFDRAGVKREWQRILKPDGHVLLFWNSRRTKSTPFLREYEELLHQYGTDYRAINHQNISDKDISEFFRPASPHRIELFNRQVFDFDGVRGRLESSSYAPAPGHPSYEPMIERLRQIVEDHGNDGVVTMEYDLVAWLGRISELGNS
jgi:SAM-dependent methyltransferase